MGNKIPEFLRKSVFHRKNTLETSKAQKVNVKPPLHFKCAFHRK